MNKLMVFLFILISVFLYSHNAYSCCNLCANISGNQYTCANANGLIAQAINLIAQYNPNFNNWWATCNAANWRAYEADVAIDQCLRWCAGNSCLKGNVEPLIAISNAFIQVDQLLQARCGINSSYTNTIGKLSSWRGAPVCAPQAPNSRCQQYAQAAVYMSNLNVSRGCGNKGNRWLTDFNSHYTWCLSASENFAHQEAQARKILMDNCK